MGKSELSVQVLAEAEYDAWRSLVAESPDGSIYSTPEYLDALCSAAGGTFRVLALQQGTELVGGVAVYERATRFGSYVSPRLLLYYNGPVLRRYDTRYPSQETARHLKACTALEAAISGAGYGSVKLKLRSTLRDARPFLASGWSARVGYTYVVDLTDLEAAWSRIEQNLRRLVERCGREGISFGDDDDFDSFYRLHAGTMERADAPTYLDRDAFRAFFERLRGQGLCRLFHARLPDGRVAASQLVLLGPHPVTHTVTAGGDPELMKTGATAFLRWRTFEALAGMGYAANDLTDASLNPVTHFKSQLGGELQSWLELWSPQTRAFRWGSEAAGMGWRARGAAGAVARRGLGLLRR
jgi:hypothetical protein